MHAPTTARTHPPPQERGAYEGALRDAILTDAALVKALDWDLVDHMRKQLKKLTNDGRLRMVWSSVPHSVKCLLTFSRPSPLAPRSLISLHARMPGFASGPAAQSCLGKTAWPVNWRVSSPETSLAVSL